MDQGRKVFLPVVVLLLAIALIQNRHDAPPHFLIWSTHMPQVVLPMLTLLLGIVLGLLLHPRTGRSSSEQVRSSLVGGAHG